MREITFSQCSGIPIFVNIHPVELSERWLVRPDDPIFSYDHEVYLEITESVPFSHYDLCVSVIRELRQRGQVHLVIDDLGSGYSNFKRISDLYPEFVKLDIDLIKGIDTNQRQQELVASTVSLCTNMGAEVIAEGIETVEQLKTVMKIGIRYGQGFLFGMPAYPIEDLKWPLVEGRALSALRDGES